MSSSAIVGEYRLILEYFPLACLVAFAEYRLIAFYSDFKDGKIMLLSWHENSPLADRY